MRKSFLIRGAGLVLAGLILGPKALGHNCSPSPITVEVGKTITYRIVADVQESEPSFYNLSINEHPEIATVSPDNFTALNYGEFRIRGVSPGTNQVVLEWAYEPFDASGFCVVEVIVVEPTPITSGTAANYPQSATANDPVNVLTGELVLLEEPDFDLGGPMPLVFQRYYASRLLRDGLVQSSLGRNWAHNFDLRLIRDGDWIEVVFYQGASISFEREGEAWVPARASSGTFQLVETDGGYLLGDPRDGKHYKFNSEGQLVEIADRKGNKHTLTYEGLLLKEVADGLGRTMTFSYGGFQELRSITEGSRTVFFNQSGRNLVRVTNVAGDSTEYSYENGLAEGSLLTARKLPRGNTPFTQVYNSEGRVISQLDADGNEWKFDYTFTTNIVTVVMDPTTNTTTFRHNMNGQLVELTDGNGKTIRFGYDEQGRRSSILDREGALTLYEFHPEAGRVASIRHANGGTTQFTYTSYVSEGLTFYDLTRLVHPDGTDETFRYDSNGNRIEHVDQAGNTNRFTFTPRGQMAGSTNALGGGITYTYNEDGTLASVKDHSGNETSFTYNTLRQVIEEKHPDGTMRQFLRNHRNQIVVLTNELGGVVTYSYDKNGNRTEELQPTGNRETFTYDAMDRMIGLTVHGEPIGLTFDDVGRLKTLTDRSSNTTTWNYDQAGHITTINEPGSRTWAQTVDAEGVPQERTDPLGKRQEFTSDVLGKIGDLKTAEGRQYGFSRDIMGRVTGLRQPDGTMAERIYDERGNVTREVLPGGTVSAEIEFNGIGQIKKVLDPNGEPWETTFDEQGRIVTRRDPLSKEVAQEFDNRGRPNKITFPEEMGHLDVTYDGLNAITRRNYSDGTDLVYNYNSQGHFIGGTGLTVTRNTEGEIIECNGLGLEWEGGLVKRITVAPEKVITYTYNNRNLVESINDWVGVAVTFSYDDAGQLIGISRANSVNASFTYDDDGYVTSLTEGTASLLLERDSNGRVASAERTTPAAAVLAAESRGFTYDAASQLETGTYDHLGDLMQDGGRNYTWDLSSRLTQYTENGTTVSLTYDCMGNRLTRSENGSTRSYVWNYTLGIPSMMVMKDGDAPIWFFIYTPDGRLSYSLEASTGNRRFYHFDEIGNTLFLSDKDGVIVASYAHGPYGEDLGASGVADNPFTWQGRFGVMQESDTGLYYMRARYYDSRSARFLSRDPLRSTVPEAINPYQYARGNPLRFIDPLGLDPQGSGDQTPQIPNGSARNAVTVKPDSALTDPEMEEGEPPRWQHGETVHLTDREWNIEVAITKKKLRDRVKQYGWFDPQTAMGFDSIFLRYQRVTFYFRGHYMSGGNLNYYFQGMLWAEMGVPKEVLIAAIYHWKWYKYNADPNPLDIFAACEGFKDNANFVTELRSEFQNEVNKLPTVPRVIVQDVVRGGLIGHMLDWFYFD